MYDEAKHVCFARVVTDVIYAFCPDIAECMQALMALSGPLFRLQLLPVLPG